MRLITRREFVQQTTFAAATLYGCPLKVTADFHRMFESREQNVAPFDSAVIRKLASEIRGRVITTDAPDYYYCVIKRGLHKKDSWTTAAGERERWFVARWRSTEDYAAGGVPGEPRGRNCGGTSGMGKTNRPARAEGEKRLRSATRNP
jgi:hypothetical protein